MDTSTDPIDWDYPINNYTAYGYDYSPNILPRYRFVYGPKQAYFLNGLPERTDLNADTDPYVLTLMLLQAFVGTLVHGLSFYYVWVNPKLSITLRAFLLADCYSRIDFSLAKFYHAHCVITWTCVDGHGYPVAWLLVNLIWTNYDRGLDNAAQFNAIGLSLNRFFAVFFNGLHYHYVEKIGIPYILVSWTFFEVLFLHAIGTTRDNNAFHIDTYNGYWFDPFSYLAICPYSKGPIGEWLLVNMARVNIGMIAITAALDMPTFLKIRSMKKRSSPQVNQAEFKLLVMILITHGINVSEASAIELLILIGERGALIHYFLVSFVPSIFRLAMGFAVIHFMRTPPSKATNSMAPLSVTT